MSETSSSRSTNRSSVIMTLSILAPFLLFALAALCSCCPNTISTNLQPPVDIVPYGYEKMLSLAEERCSEPLSGKITFTDEPVCRLDREGCIRWGICDFNIYVTWAPRVTWTELGHELGHYCLQTEDQNDAEEFGIQLNIDTESEL